MPQTGFKVRAIRIFCAKCRIRSATYAINTKDFNPAVFNGGSLQGKFDWLIDAVSYITYIQNELTLVCDGLAML